MPTIALRNFEGQHAKVTIAVLSFRYRTMFGPSKNKAASSHDVAETNPSPQVAATGSRLFA
jgi:hypothetical protein